MFDALFSDGFLRSYIKDNTKDPWEETPFRGYVFMSPKQKGEFGERFVSAFFKEMLLCDVKKAPSGTAGHDRVIDSIRTEIKFSLATRGKNGIKADSFIINHVSKDKDWERLVFFGINPDEKDCRFIWFSKEDFIANLGSSECCFSVQQGGKAIQNDDYMCTQVAKLIEQPFVKGVTEW